MPNIFYPRHRLPLGSISKAFRFFGIRIGFFLFVLSGLFILYNIPTAVTPYQPQLAVQSAQAATLKPGLYVFEDNGLSRGSYPWIVGSAGVGGRWNTFQPGSSTYNWGELDNRINVRYNEGKRVIIRITPHDGVWQGNSVDGTPSWVYDQGVPKIYAGDGGVYPKYWDSTYRARLGDFIRAFGARYNGDSRVEAVEMGIGIYGEEFPGGANGGDDPAWSDAGLNESVWESYVKEIIDDYVAAFPSTPLISMEQFYPRGDYAQIDRVADYAASKGVGMAYNGLRADNPSAYKDCDLPCTKPGWFTPFAEHVRTGEVLGRLEAQIGWNDPTETYWAILNGLDSGVTYLSIYSQDVDDSSNEAIFNFGNKYAGYTIQNTPGVWVALRANTGTYMGKPGNFGLGITQYDPDGTSADAAGLGPNPQGRYARKTDSSRGLNYLSFNIADSYLYQVSSGTTVDITVTYLDSGNDTWELQYDAVGNSTKVAGVVYKSNSGTWKKQTFTVTDAYFGNRQPNSNDFRIYSRSDGADTFHMIEVVKRSGTSNQPPTANASATPTSGTYPLTVAFSSASSFDSDGTISGYSWNFGNGVTSTQANPSYTYQSAGIYTVTLTVTDNQGATGTASATITVTVPTTGNLLANPGFETGSVTPWAGWQASVSVSSAASRTGSYGSKTAFTTGTYGNVYTLGQNPLVTNATAGQTYYATAWVKGEGTSIGKTIEVTIREAGAQTLETSSDSTVKLTSAWQQLSVNRTITQAGSTLDVYVGQSGAVSGDYFYADDLYFSTTPPAVNQPPTANASATPTSGTYPLTVAFSSASSFDSDGTISGYSWNFGNGVTSTQANPSYTYQSAGIYTVTLTVTDNQGATGTASATITVTVPTTGNLLANPGFETGSVTPWAGWQASVVLSNTARTGAYGAKVTSTATTWGTAYSVGNEPGELSNPFVGQTYTATAWVKGGGNTLGRNIQIVMRERSGTDSDETASSAITLTSTWQRVSVSRAIVFSGSMVDIYVLQQGTGIGDYFFVDDLSLVTVVSPKVEQWTLYEISLAAAGSYGNAYTDVAVTATFSGPGGASKTVRGFWDGDKYFKVRFTPTASGIWTYSINSTPADSGLTRIGSLEATAPISGNHGFLRRDANNPYSFVFDDGSRYFMWGQTYYEIIRNAMTGNNWKVAIDNSKAKGMNKVRMLIYPWPASENPYPDSQPFLSATDHDQLNLSHWNKLDDIIKYLSSKDMIADLIIFTDAERAFGNQAQDERFVRYALARFAGYRNVIWTLTNEWESTNKAKDYWNGIGGIVKNEDPWMTNGVSLRPLSVHQKTGIAFQFFDATWPTHAVIQYGVRNGSYTNGDKWGNNGIISNLGRNMPVVNDEYGYIGETSPVNLTRPVHRNVIWGIAVAGGYGSAGDLRLSNGAYPIFSSDWYNASGYYGDIQKLVDFWTNKGIQYWQMTSQNKIVTSGARVYVLGKSGLGYVVYSAAYKTYKLNLPSGSYQVQWFNPVTGAVTNKGTVNGGLQSFTPPFSGDSVLYLSVSVSPILIPLSESQLPTSSASKSIRLSEGALLQENGQKDIYAIRNGGKVLIPSWDSFTAAGYKMSEVQNVSSSEFAAIKSNNILKAVDDPKIYALEKGLLHYIPTPEVFNSYKLGWSDITTVSSRELAAFGQANLIRGLGQLKVYLLDGLVKRWISDADIFNARKYDWNKIIDVNSSELDSYSTGDVVRE